MFNQLAIAFAYMLAPNIHIADFSTGVSIRQMTLNGDLLTFVRGACGCS
jgi:hypothetical protein